MNSTLLEEHKEINLTPEGALLGDPGVQPLGPVNASTGAATLPDTVARRLIGGTSMLGLGTVIERGTGFLANILAARFAGAASFGAYSFAISTANNISTYAAGGIGATAARFSGKYPYESRGYATLGRALAVVSLVSALIAVIVLWLGAAPLANLSNKPTLTYLLRWAALSAAGIILLECARGFFVGQRRLAALLLLSVIVGGGMVTLLPAAANRHDPVRMVVVQGAITSTAVLVCLLLARPLGLFGPKERTGEALPLMPMLREVWSFGLVQLAGLVGSNLAGLWMTVLVGRSDPKLIQMGFLTIGMQLRNLVGIAPSLLTEGSYAVMADPGGEATRTPHRVMALCTFASLAVSLMLAALGIVFVPWGLTLLYGKAYSAAGMTVAIALAIAVVHMGNAPAAARLTIVSIRSTGIINTVWAIFVAAAASSFLVFGGGAWQAMVIYFLAHLLSSGLVLVALHRMDHIPAGMTALYVFATCVSSILAALAVLRGFRPELSLPITSVMFLLSLAAAGGLYLFGKRFGWLPTAAAMNRLKSTLTARFRKKVPHAL